MTRSYESNGPDVKIRGNAHHVAEKYLQLARDAHTGGDPVAAENFLQHAEHYYRLIAAAQAAQLLAQSGRPPSDDDEDDDDDGSVLNDRFASPAERAPPPFTPPAQPYAPQPSVGAPAGQFNYGERQPFDGERQNPQSDRNGFQPRQDRPPNRHQDRGPRPDRPYHERQDNRGVNDARPREFRPYRDPNPAREPQPSLEPTAPVPALPSFITTAPPRVVPGPEAADPQPPMVTDVAEANVAAETPPPPDEPVPEGRFPPRGRRRRLRSPYGFHGGANAEDAITPANPGDPPASD